MIQPLCPFFGLYLIVFPLNEDLFVNDLPALCSLVRLNRLPEIFDLIHTESPVEPKRLR